jgi:hypothetical protein
MKKTGARSAHTTASARGAQPTTAMGERPVGYDWAFREGLVNERAPEHTLCNQYASSLWLRPLHGQECALRLKARKGTLPSTQTQGPNNVLKLYIKKHRASQEQINIPTGYESLHTPTCI